MSDILGISSGAISAYQRALSTVSNNIANVNTEGYSRQDVVLKDSAPKKLASMYVGTGVMLQNIRRQYDEFAESNLRNSNSDLSAQTPMVDYTKRVMDIMGDKSIGLSSALDDFFSVAGGLSADPASTVMRTSFLRSADGVSSRFAELSGQLDLISSETQQGLDSVVQQINTLTEQLALVNQSLTRGASLEAQPAELLDRRDLTLRKLSELVRIKVSFTTNGTVSVSAGTTMTQGLLVEGIKSHPVGVDRSVQGKTEFVLDPYGNTEALPTISGGKLGGYQTFITQVLEPAQKNLNSLAKVFVDETNAIQTNGIDGYGQTGQALFAIDSKQPQLAAGIRLSLTDGMRVATAAQFRVSEGTANSTNTRATVRYSGTKPAQPLSNPRIVNNPNPSAGTTFNVNGAMEYVPVTTLSAGVGATFYLDNMAPGQELQVMTRDGRQLLGKALTETEKYQLMTPANGFAAGLNYSDAYLNQSGDKAYRGLDMFYGAKSAVQYQPQYDGQGLPLPAKALPAALASSRIAPSSQTIGDANLTINGIALSAFQPNAESSAKISGVRLGSVANFGGFSFKMRLGGTEFKVPYDSTSAPLTSITNLADLATELQDSLRYADAGRGDISVTVAANGADLIVSDAKKRDITQLGFQLDDAQTTAGAQTGDVHVLNDAVQLADWFNGTSKAQWQEVNFGTGTPGFADFTMRLGAVDYRLKFPPAGSSNDPKNLQDLASWLQSGLRDLDHSTNLSVRADGRNLILEDQAGRKIESTVLTPKADAQDASSGLLNISNSTVSQSQVHAKVFSEVRVPTKQLDFTRQLKINGKLVPQNVTLNGKSVAVNDADKLAMAINAADAGVTAGIGTDGQLTLTSDLGAPITIDKLTDGNALGIEPSTYYAQIRYEQEARHVTVPATSLSFERPLEINGVRLIPGAVAYDLPPAGTSTTVTWADGPAGGISATSASELATKLNAVFQDKDNPQNYFAFATATGKVVIQSLNATDADDAVAEPFTFNANGGTLTAQVGIKTKADFLQRLQDFSSQIGVTAGLDENGDLQLSTTDRYGSGELSVGPAKNNDGTWTSNALGLEPLDYNVSKRLEMQLADHPETRDIRISMTKEGRPVDLARIGLRTGAYMEGGCPDDLLLFVTGKGSAQVAASYSGTPSDPRDSLRQQSLKLVFTAADRYQVVDRGTGTVLADRHYDTNIAEPIVDFQGLKIQLNHAPGVGDVFNIDGNQDGLGNNVNMLDMVDLAKRPVTEGKTIHNAYVDHINDVGNLAQQATITQSALKVVNDQAVASRDKVAGVNLDEEAAALVRYQQAYQAAAKALQVSGQLFDAVVQIR